MTENNSKKRSAIKRPIDEIVDQSNDSLKALQAAMGSGSELQRRMEDISNMGQNSALSHAAKQIAKHQNALDTISSLHQKMYDPIMDNPDWHRVNSAKRAHEISEHLANIKNPIDETNKRLANIEGQFGEIREIAIESANIANNLNAAAAEFLMKFEQAALSNERSARKAIWTGLIAIIIAAVPAIHIIYDAFWQSPRESAQMHAAISGFETEISELKENQNKSLGDLIDTLEKSDGSAVTVLHEIKDLLSKKTEEQNGNL